MARKRRLEACTPTAISMRMFSANDDAHAKAQHYKEHQVLHMRTGLDHVLESPLESMRKLFSESSEAVRAIISQSFTIEGLSSQGLEGQKAADLFGVASTQSSTSFYCSCIIQSDKTLVDRVLSFLPFPDGVPSGMFVGSRHSEPVWLFIGRNEGKKDMQGRPEHTDAVTHSGTWHYQLCGSKKWYVRKAESEEWGASSESVAESSGQRPKKSSDNDAMCIECLPGDVLFINTRLWRHHTEIPPTSGAVFGLSASLARDFYCDAVACQGGPTISLPPSSSASSLTVGEVFTNIDGIYATKNVPEGCIVLRESELPDCSLPRSLQANCEVGTAEDEATGEEEMCLIARYDIKVR